MQKVPNRLFSAKKSILHLWQGDPQGRVPDPPRDASLGLTPRDPKRVPDPQGRILATHLKFPCSFSPFLAFQNHSLLDLSFSICLSKHSLAHFPDLLFGSIQDHSLPRFRASAFWLSMNLTVFTCTVRFPFNCFNPLTSLGQTHFLTICSRNWLGAVLQT